MPSIFTLPQVDLVDDSELHELTYVKVEPQKTYQGRGFPGGDLNMKLDVADGEWIIPNISPVVIRVRMTNGDGSEINSRQLAVDGGDKAVNYAVCANLFQSGNFKINGKVVSKIEENMAQIDAADKRLHASGYMLNNYLGDTNSMIPSFAERQQILANDGSLTSHVSQETKPTGTSINIAAGVNATVIGIGTAFLTELRIGDILRFNTEDREFLVKQVIDDLNAIVYENPGTLTGAIAVSAWTIQRGNKLTSQRGGREFVWSAPMGIMKISHGLPGNQSYELSLTPESSTEYMKRSIQSLINELSQRTQLDDGGTADQIQFDVQEIFWYVAIAKGPSVRNAQYMLDLTEVTCQIADVTSVSKQKKPFTVDDTTVALACAFQAQNCGEDTRLSCSKFKFPANVAADQQSVDSGELGLTKLYLQYANQKKPDEDADPQYDRPFDFITRLYSETQLYSNKLFNDAGPESKTDWIDNGPLYYYSWPRHASDRSTEVRVNYAFGGLSTGQDDFNVLLFNWYKNKVIITLKTGSTTTKVGEVQ